MITMTVGYIWSFLFMVSHNSIISQGTEGDWIYLKCVAVLVVLLIYSTSLDF